MLPYMAYIRILWVRENPNLNMDDDLGVPLYDDWRKLLHITLDGKVTTISMGSSCKVVTQWSECWFINPMKSMVISTLLTIEFTKLQTNLA